MTNGLMQLCLIQVKDSVWALAYKIQNWRRDTEHAATQALGAWRSFLAPLSVCNCGP